MTSDFENDEIKDSTFPVEFADDGAPLDMYGVWVKNGPRDAATPESTAKKTATDLERASVDAPASEWKDSEKNPVNDDFDELPDLPDFTFGEVVDQKNEPGDAKDIEQPIVVSAVPEPKTEESGEDFTIGEIRFEEIESDSIASAQQIPSVPETHEAISVPKKETNVSDFNAVDASEFLDDLEITVDSLENVQSEDTGEDFVAEIGDGKITFEEIRSDELFGRAARTEPVKDMPSRNRTEEKPVSLSDFEDVPLEFIDAMESSVQPSVNIEDTEINAGAMDFVESPEIAQLDEVDASREPFVMPDFQSEPVISSDETTIEPPILEGPASFEETANVPVDEFSGITVPSDDDFSSFLDDLNSGSGAQPPRPASGSENIDLDSFIDSFNESGGVSHENTTELYDDIDPVDLELEFDESFIEDSEKIRATGATVSESEFFNSEFGVELIDETSVASVPSPEDEDLSALAASIETMVSPDSGAAKSASFADSFETANEFDDLLQSLDLAPAPAQAKNESQSTRSVKPRSFDLVVTEEDDQGSIQASIMETATSDEVDIPLFDSVPQEKVPVQPEPTQQEFLAAQENLDIPVIRDYNDTQSGHETDLSVSSVVEENMAPDFDDISAVEQELNDLTPDTGEETVVTNDKSTELLMIIADELSSIKKELTTLKSELSTFKAAGLNAEPGVTEVSASSENSGFFSDDDTDETIALTGDELNNILITADFTEEKSESEEAVDIEAPVAEGPLDDTASEPSANEPGIATIENVSLDEGIEEDIPETLPDSFFEMPQLDTAAPIEVSHVTTVEDDVSYLEGSAAVDPELDNVAIEEPDLETIDFDDEKLEEPELTEFNIDLSDIASDLSAGQEVPVPEQEESVAFEAPVLASDGAGADIDFPEPGVIEDSLTGLEPEPQHVEASLSEEPVLEAAVGETAEETLSQAGSAETEVAPVSALPIDLKNEIKSVLSYMDQLLESLPEEKIEEFARSEHFEVYKKLFEELGIS